MVNMRGLKSLLLVANHKNQFAKSCQSRRHTTENQEKAVKSIKVNPYHDCTISGVNSLTCHQLLSHLNHSTRTLPLTAWLSLFGLLGLLALAKFSPKGGRIRRLAPLATLALLIAFSVACGAGSSSASSTTTNSNATPAGTYTLTVTGTSGSLTQSTQITLKVQ